MARHSGGNRVGEGTYWNPGNGSLVSLREEDILPGDDRSVYYRVPFPLLFPLGVILGGLYVAALPLAAIGSAVSVLFRRLFGDLLARARVGVSFGWRPTEAYLAGKERRTGAAEDRETAEREEDPAERGRNNFPRI